MNIKLVVCCLFMSLPIQGSSKGFHWPKWVKSGGMPAVDDTLTVRVTDVPFSTNPQLKIIERTLYITAYVQARSGSVSINREMISRVGLPCLVNSDDIQRLRGKNGELVIVLHKIQEAESSAS